VKVFAPETRGPDTRMIEQCAPASSDEEEFAIAIARAEFGADYDGPRSALAWLVDRNPAPRGDEL
jgi:hypothetical protein